MNVDDDCENDIIIEGPDNHILPGLSAINYDKTKKQTKG